MVIFRPQVSASESHRINDIKILVILYLIRNELVNNRLGIVLELVRIPSSFAEVGRLLTGGVTEMPERERERNKEKYDQEFDQKYDRCGPCGDTPEIGSVAMSRLLPPTLTTMSE